MRGTRALVKNHRTCAHLPHRKNPHDRDGGIKRDRPSVPDDPTNKVCALIEQTLLIRLISCTVLCYGPGTHRSTEKFVKTAKESLAGEFGAPPCPAPCPHHT